MRLGQLYEIMKIKNIPMDANLQSDSGWECGATGMNCAYYNRQKNIIVFTQNLSEYETYYNSKEWELIFGIPFKEIDKIRNKHVNTSGFVNEVECNYEIDKLIEKYINNGGKE